MLNKFKRKRKRSRGNLPEGREAPPRRCLYPLRFRFRFRLNLLDIRKFAQRPALADSLFACLTAAQTPFNGRLAPLMAIDGR